MKAHLYRITALAIFLALLGGCAGRTDLTQTLEVQRSGSLGRWYAVRADSDLIKRYQRLMIVAPDDSLWQGTRRVGKVGAGTRIVSCRVVRDTDLVAFMVLPVTYTHEYVLGKIVDGPYAGNEVSLSDPYGTKLDAIPVPATQPVQAADRPDNPPTQCTEPAGKILVVQGPAQRGLGR